MAESDGRSDVVRALALCQYALAASQDEDGSWPGDYGGPQFLLPLFIACGYIAGIPLSEHERSGMERYIRGCQTPEGGWGIHVEGPSTVYGTSVNYVALRLLGVNGDDAALVQARRWLHQRGGPTGSASWGKFFLALLNLYPYDGLNPVPPELWLMPQRLALHPSKWWCHCRMVYLPMSYLYARRCQAPMTPLLGQLREELFPVPWQEVDFAGARHLVAAEDRLVEQHPLLSFANRLLLGLERRWPAALRERAVQFVLHQIEREDQNTAYICLGPINKLLNLLVWHFEDPSGPELARHVVRLRDYLWEGADGIKMQGYESSRTWDTALAIQALCSFGASAHTETLERAHGFIVSNQVRSNVRDHQSAFRQPSRGGWTFSGKQNGWIVADCTAEGLLACLALEGNVREPLPATQLVEAVELLLSMQNDDGGWATYERERGPKWLEALNPSDCFRNIMVDYSYVECTSACVQALAAVRSSERPVVGTLGGAIDAAIDRGRAFLLRAQRDDGGFFGSWGVCFTYGTWFGIRGLRAAGLGASHPAVERAATFLISKQRSDGGWGESVENCNTGRYDMATESQAVMTAWAVLGLLCCDRSHRAAVERGIAFLLRRQRADGTFPPENIAGVFNGTCAINYDNYSKIFPLWALGAYQASRAATRSELLGITDPDSQRAMPQEHAPRPRDANGHSTPWG